MRRRFGADVVLAILLPVVAVLALLLLVPTGPSRTVRPRSRPR